MNQTPSETRGSRVCVLPVEEGVSVATLSVAIDSILNFRNYRLLRIFARQEVVGVKPCLNEPKRSLEYVVAVIRMLRARGVTPMICDTTDRYRDVNRNGIKRMEELGSCDGNQPTPVVILDGIMGENDLVVRGTDGKPDAHLAGELPSLGGAVIISHSRRDSLAGLSGAVVNMGVGFASKRGKIQHFAMHPPRVQQDKCYACRRCQRYCPTGAIGMGKAHVVINPTRCINCGRCVEIAHFGGITYSWDATPEHFRATVTTHAHAAFDVLRHRVVFISVVDAPASDTTSQAALLFSRDPVAIDSAATQWLAENGRLYQDEQQQAITLLEQAEALGLGRRQYRLEHVAF